MKGQMLWICWVIPRQPPGKGFKYSGGGYLVVQQMVEDVTGRPLGALAKELIFDKLGMANSTFDSRLPQVYIPQAATGHNRAGKPVPGRHCLRARRIRNIQPEN